MNSVASSPRGGPLRRRLRSAGASRSQSPHRPPSPETTHAPPLSGSPATPVVASLSLLSSSAGLYPFAKVITSARLSPRSLPGLSIVRASRIHEVSPRGRATTTHAAA